MALTMDEVAEFAETHSPREFRAAPFYERHTDSIILYAKDCPSYASRLNALITVFLSEADDLLVGFEVKGVTGLIERCRKAGVAIRVERDRVQLRSLVEYSVGAPPVSPEAGPVFDMFLATWQTMRELHELEVETARPEAPRQRSPPPPHCFVLVTADRRLG